MKRAGLHGVHALLTGLDLLQVVNDGLVGLLMGSFNKRFRAVTGRVGLFRAVRTWACLAGEAHCMSHGPDYVGNHHICTPIITPDHIIPKKHNCTPRTTTKTLAHIPFGALLESRGSASGSLLLYLGKFDKVAPAMLKGELLKRRLVLFLGILQAPGMALRRDGLQARSRTQLLPMACARTTALTGATRRLPGRKVEGKHFGATAVCFTEPDGSQDSKREWSRDLKLKRRRFHVPAHASTSFVILPAEQCLEPTRKETVNDGEPCN